MPEEDDKLNPMAALWKWLLTNGKEASAFLIVMAAALYMFTDMREQAQQNRLQQSEMMKELRDREIRAWDMRGRDRVDSYRHAEEMGQKFDKLTDSMEELVRTLKLTKSKTP